MRKNILLFLIACVISIISIPLNASANTKATIEVLADGYYFETIFEDSENPSEVSTIATTNYITKTKTTQLKNSEGTVLWSVSIKATFSYDGTTSKCTSCTPSATSYASAWSIKSVTSSKSGNSATATAIATNTFPSGATQDIKKSVTIQCSATGIIS